MTQKSLKFISSLYLPTLKYGTKKPWIQGEQWDRRSHEGHEVMCGLTRRLVCHDPNSYTAHVWYLKTRLLRTLSTTVRLKYPGVLGIWVKTLSAKIKLQGYSRKFTEQYCIIFLRKSRHLSKNTLEKRCRSRATELPAFLDVSVYFIDYPWIHFVVVIYPMPYQQIYNHKTKTMKAKMSFSSLIEKYWRSINW